MNFDRNRAQSMCEELVGCYDLNTWSNYKNAFESIELSSGDAMTLKTNLFQDANDYYFKGVLSLFEGINGLTRNLFSWATVKLYYSIYYLLRCTLSAKGHALIRNKSLYLLKAQNSAKPVRKNHRTRHRNLHIATIHIFEELYKASDILQSNSLDGKNVYIWLMERRNQVNYRERVFHDPKCPVFWSSIAEEIDHKNLNDLISKYVDDTNYIYCFQKEDACLALPIKRAMLTKEDMLKENCKTKIPNEKLKLLKALYKKTEKLDFLFE